MEKTNGVITIIEEYKQHLVADGKSPSTIESCLGDVVGFIAWIIVKWLAPSNTDKKKKLL